MTFQKVRAVFIKKHAAVAGIIFSGLCWYISNGLTGDFWYLLWIAPLPVLLISFDATAKQTFLVSFVAYLIGRLSWFSYLVTVATIVPAIIFTVTMPLIFALIVVLTKYVMVKNNSWFSVFAFPTFFTTFEWLMMEFSPDGTAASIVYSQSDNLPLIQIAAVTGILGITFVVTFIPSAVAMCWHFRQEKRKLFPLIITTSMLVVIVFVYGFARINNNLETKKTLVGLVVLDEKTHKMGDLNFQNEIEHTQNYVSEINVLASQGAKLVVLPERAINVSEQTDSATIGILSACAKRNRISIVVGYTNFKDKIAHNSALVINERGDIVLDYNKVHLVKGLEDQFAPGHYPGTFKFDGSPAGIAICKDLDFPEYIIQYVRYKAAFLCVPAWDFVVDDWLHSRMAILRGVENGFSIARTARLGRLTISDPWGRVSAEANCSNGKATAFVGQIFPHRIDTFYSRYGDWFGWVVLIVTFIFLFLTLFKKKNNIL